MDEHRMWLAWDAVLAGNSEEAARYVALPQETEGALAQFVTALIQAALTLRSSQGPTANAQKFSELVNAAKSNWPGAWRRRLARRLVRQLRRLVYDERRPFPRKGSF